MTSCINCKDGVYVNPHAQRHDNLCPLCGGTGWIGPKCFCGRPAVLTREGYVANQVVTCGRKECKELALTQMAVVEADDDETEWEQDIYPHHFRHLL